MNFLHLLIQWNKIWETLVIMSSNIQFNQILFHCSLPNMCMILAWIINFSYDQIEFYGKILKCTKQTIKEQNTVFKLNIGITPLLIKKVFKNAINIFSYNENKFCHRCFYVLNLNFKYLSALPFVSKFCSIFF